MTLDLVPVAFTVLHFVLLIIPQLALEAVLEVTDLAVLGDIVSAALIVGLEELDLVLD